MAESEYVPFIIWSILTGIIVGASGLSYRAYQRRQKDEKSSP